MMIRRIVAAASIAIAGAAVPLVGPVPYAVAAPGDTYISNPPANPADQGFCEDQAALANNLSAKGDFARADGVVSAANMSGCRIYTFSSP
ncbi:hypothetical protein ACFTZB_06095 [Rhodococcus sp. NPDC057014]|uniref:hypothetical protein n=1 Tax=unclassified Rhodococcus (in: high G+C Gram-positive bacteria) TaxID=192944 RepID=UPI00363AE8A4